MKTLLDDYGAVILSTIGGAIALALIAITMFGTPELIGIKDILSRIIASLIGG